jgi:N-methylhydantoinase A/oxoprolinase/acetone carboxylase beta subunit
LLVENADDRNSVDGPKVSRLPYQPGDEVDYPGCVVSLQLNATARLSHPALEQGNSVEPSPATSASHRSVRATADRVDEIPVYVLDEVSPGHAGEGAAIIEGPFFTARVLPGWTFRVTSAGDLLLTDNN